MALDFVKRHPMKCTATFLFGGCVSGGYLLYRRVKHQLMDMSQQMQHSSLEKVRKSQYFQSNLQTADALVFTLISPLKAKLLQVAGVEFVVEQLREGSPNKDVLWENLKVKTFTRLISSIYLLSGLSLLVRIELNIIGGIMFAESVREGKTDNKDTDRELSLKGKDELQTQYIDYCKYSIEAGCQRLLTEVEPVVRRVLNRFSIKQVVSFAEFDQILAEIKTNLEGVGEDGKKINFEQIFLPTENPEFDKDFDLLVDYTRDILDQDFPHLLSLCVKTCFLYISRWTAAQCPDTSKDGVTIDTELSVQIAKLVISISKCFEALFADNQQSMLHQLLTKKEVFLFSQHIYEAFSSN